MTREEMVRSAVEIQETLQSPGWAYILAMLNEQSEEPRDELYEILSTSKGDSIALATARRLATRSRALKDFKESVYGRLKILTQPV